MTAGAIIWAGLLVALFGLFIVVARRMTGLIARTRELERIQVSVGSIDGRLAAAIDPLDARHDGIRRHGGDAAALARDLGPTRVLLQDLAVEAGALRMPAGLAAQASVLVNETKRAAAAADLVVRGLDATLSGSGSIQAEAQTSLKRGALNLRHAREAVGQVAAEIAALRPADLAPGAVAGRPNAASPGGAPFAEDADPELEEPSEPRM